MSATSASIRATPLVWRWPAWTTVEGDRYFIAFTDTAVFAWGFAHESPMNPFMRTPVAVWPGLLEGMPAHLEPVTRDARFQIAGTFMATAAFWSERGQPWRTGSATAPTDKPDADGAEELFELLLDGGPQAYARFAQEYLEMSPREAAVEAVYQSESLDPTILAELNPDAQYLDVRQQVDAMGRFRAVTDVRKCRDERVDDLRHTAAQRRYASNPCAAECPGRH